MHTSSTHHNWLPHAAIIACAFIAVVWQLLSPGYYCKLVEDVAYTHKYILQFTESFRQGILYPRWMAESFGGYGSPVFVYYSPAVYWFAGLLGLCGIGPSLSIFILQLISLCIGGLSVFYLVRMRFGQRAAVIAAIIYCLIPGRVINLYYLNTYAGRFAEAFMPLTLLFTSKLVDGPFSRRYLAGTALSYAALILSHLATAYIFTPFLIAYAFIYTGAPFSRVWLRLAAALLAGMGLASFFFLPVLLERSHVHLGLLESIPAYSYLANFVLNLTGNRTFESTAQLRNLLMVSLVAETGIALAIVYLAWRKAGLAFEREVVFLSSSIIICMFMMSSLSAPIWKNLPGLPTIAFSFRFVPIFIVFVSALLGVAIDRLLQERMPVLMAASAAVLVLVLAYYDVRLVIKAFQPITETDAGHIGASWDMLEYLPATASPESVDRLKSDDPRLTVTGGSAEIKNWGYIDRELLFDGKDGGTLRLKTILFPGWRGFIDGQECSLYPETGTGAIQLNVPAGRHYIRLSFMDTPPRAWGKAISLVTLAALVFPYGAVRRRRTGKT